jgi:type I restriction enzyme S subunit
MVPSGWNIESIESFCKVSSSKRIMQSDYVEKGIAFYRSKEIILKSKGIEPTDIIYIDINKFKNLKDKFGAPEDGDILISAVGTLGKCYLVKPNEEFYFKDGNLLWLRKLKGVEQSYLVQFMNSPYFQNEIQNITGGSSQKALTIIKLARMKLPLPPLPEQRKIAKTLSTWDKAISTTERLIDNSKQQKKALMQQLLTGKKRLLDDSGKPFEGEWKECTLKECATCLDNRRVPINSMRRQGMQGSIPYWGANGIVDYVNEFIFDETIVLLAEDGGYFDEFSHRPIANISYGKSWVNNHAHILKAKEETFNEWLYYSLVHKNILAFINGGTRAKLNKSDMLKISIKLPQKQEQHKIVDVLTNADKEIELLERQLSDLKQEKKALMQQLLTGKRRVKVNEKEVA